MSNMIRADAASAWRDRARYDRLLGFDKTTWAWECLRRSLGGQAVRPCQATWTRLRVRPALCVLTIRGCERACRHTLPLLGTEGAGAAGFGGHVFWCAHSLATVLRVDARPVQRGAADLFDLRALRHPTVVLRRRGGSELVLIADGPRCIRIEVRSGTVLNGPVRLAYDLADGSGAIDTKLLALRRLHLLRRLGRFPRSLFPPERRARRWAMALQAWDGRKAGATQREIAIVLHGADAVEKKWRDDIDDMRARVRRLLRTADALIGGGWRHLLG